MSNQHNSNFHRSFLNFLHAAHLKTYAGTDEERKKTKCAAPKILGHQEYLYREKNWTYFDSYAGHTFPPGKEIVFYKNKPFWAMSYQGQYINNEKTTPKEAYEFLKDALRNTTPSSPLRGPKKYIKGDWEYIFKKEGGWEYFTGKEKVYYQKKLIFFQDIMGSIIK